MTEDLVKRLRWYGAGQTIADEAADELERLTAELAERQKDRDELITQFQTTEAELAACKAHAEAYPFPQEVKALQAELASLQQRIRVYKDVTSGCPDVLVSRALLATMVPATELTETRDLAEHWSILAEQRRVELVECRKDAERYQVARSLWGISLEMEIDAEMKGAKP